MSKLIYMSHKYFLLFEYFLETSSTTNVQVLIYTR